MVFDFSPKANYLGANRWLIACVAGTSRARCPNFHLLTGEFVADLRVNLDQPRVFGAADGFQARVCIELAQDVLDVIVHRGAADVQ